MKNQEVEDVRLIEMRRPNADSNVSKEIDKRDERVTTDNEDVPNEKIDDVNGPQEEDVLSTEPKNVDITEMDLTTPKESQTLKALS